MRSRAIFFVAAVLALVPLVAGRPSRPRRGRHVSGPHVAAPWGPPAAAPPEAAPPAAPAGPLDRLNAEIGPR